MSVRVWSGMFGSLLMSSSIEIAYAARTASDSSRSSSLVLASSAARRIFLGTESSPTIWARISTLFFKVSCLSGIAFTPTSSAVFVRVEQALAHTHLLIRTLYNVLSIVCLEAEIPLIGRLRGFLAVMRPPLGGRSPIVVRRNRTVGSVISVVAVSVWSNREGTRPKLT